MQIRRDKCCSLTSGRQAAYLVEYQVLMLDDPEHVTESDWAGHGWWDLFWLEAIPLSDVAVISKERGQHEYHPDWSRATVRVGSRVPSRAVQALIAACDPAHPRVTPREALERLAVLRILETPV